MKTASRSDVGIPRPIGSRRTTDQGGCVFNRRVYARIYGVQDSTLYFKSFGTHCREIRPSARSIATVGTQHCIGWCSDTSRRSPGDSIPDFCDVSPHDHWFEPEHRAASCRAVEQQTNYRLPLAARGSCSSMYFEAPQLSRIGRQGTISPSLV